MNRLSRELVRSLKETEKNLGSPTFNFAGNNYPCVQNEARSSKILDLGGNAISCDLTLFVRKDVLPSPAPREKQTLVFNGRKFRIDKISAIAGDEVLAYICNDAREGV